MTQCSPDSVPETLRVFKKDIAHHFERVVKAIDGTFSSRCGAFKIERDTWGVHLSIGAAELLVDALRARAIAAIQPMNTAPRNGTIIDLWLTGGGRATDQSWCDEDKTWAGLEEEMFCGWSPIVGIIQTDETDK